MNSRIPNLMFPRLPGRELAPGGQDVWSGSGCRGVLGLVPQPLCMKSKVSPEGQTGELDDTKWAGDRQGRRGDATNRDYR